MYFIFPITKRRIYRWERKKKTAKLLGAMKKVMYSLKVIIIEALGNIGDKSALPDLIQFLDSPSQIVRTKAGNAILKIDHGENMVNLIKEKIAYWEKQKAENLKRVKAKNVNKPYYKFNGLFKHKLVRTQQIKEQLKRPIRWG